MENIQYCQAVRSPEIELYIGHSPNKKYQQKWGFLFCFGFLVEIDKAVVKLKWEYKASRRARTILKKKNTLGGLELSNFKNFPKATVTKRV